MMYTIQQFFSGDTVVDIIAVQRVLDFLAPVIGADGVVGRVNMEDVFFSSLGIAVSAKTVELLSAGGR